MRAPHYPQDTPAVTRATAGPRLSVLLVEDDRADALLVEELIADAALDIDFAWAPSISDAERELARNRPDCVLLDLNLPDANGIDALERISESDPAIPIVVLTGLNDEHFGISAVASGAQDYLVKGRVEPETLRRVAALRDRAQARRAHRGRTARQPTPGGENARLERGLRRRRCCSTTRASTSSRGIGPAAQNALLGGDFYDFVQTPDRTVHVMIGDVAGHGPDEAALGVALRIGWRALTFAGLRGNERMRQLERILITERPAKGIFATVLSVGIRARQPALHRRPRGPSRHAGARRRTVQWLEPPAGPALGLGAQRVAGQPTGDGPKATAWCCSPTACSRGTRGGATNASARTDCSSWRVRLRRCPARRSSTRSSTKRRRAHGARRAHRRHRGGARGADDTMTAPRRGRRLTVQGWQNLVLSVMGVVVLAGAVAGRRVAEPHRRRVAAS